MVVTIIAPIYTTPDLFLLTETQDCDGRNIDNCQSANYPNTKADVWSPGLPGAKGCAVVAQNPPPNPELSSRLKKTNEELRNLQDSVRTGMINVKVLMDFRNAAERARQASAAVQQWLETQGKGNDPYKLLPQVMGQRVEMATKLVKDVTRDLETLDVDFDTPGLPELDKAVQALAERLSKLFPH